MYRDSFFLGSMASPSVNGWARMTFAPSSPVPLEEAWRFIDLWSKANPSIALASQQTKPAEEKWRMVGRAAPIQAGALNLWIHGCSFLLASSGSLRVETPIRYHLTSVDTLIGHARRSLCDDQIYWSHYTNKAVQTRVSHRTQADERQRGKTHEKIVSI